MRGAGMRERKEERGEGELGELREEKRKMESV